MDDPGDLPHGGASAADSKKPSPNTANTANTARAVAPNENREGPADSAGGVLHGAEANGVSPTVAPLKPPLHGGMQRPRLPSKDKAAGSSIFRGQSRPPNRSDSASSQDVDGQDAKNMEENEKTIKAGSFRRPQGQHNRMVSWDDKNLAELFTAPAPSKSGAADRITSTGDATNNGPSTPTKSPLSSPGMQGIASIPSSDLSVSSNSASAQQQEGSLTQSQTQSQSPSRRGRFARTPTRKSRRKLQLGDVIDPMELEAETYILKTLEERDPTIPSASRTRAGTADYSILSNVPQEIGHEFEYVLPPPTPPKPHLSSDDPVIKAAHKLTSAADKKKHKRSLTVEQTIFGLSSALTAIHDTTTPNQNEFTRNDMNDLPLDDPAATASTDRLARAVNILFNRSRANTSGGNTTSSANASVPMGNDQQSSLRSDQEQTGASRPTLHSPNSDGTRRSAASNWRLVKGNIGNYKKDEDSVIREVDVEDGIPDNGRTSFETADDGSSNEGGEKGPENNTKSERQRRHNPFRHLPYSDKIRDEWETVNNFLKPRRSSMFLYVKIVFGYMILPLIGIAAILFYFAENPPTGRGRVYENNTTASASWWLIFAARNLVTFTFAKISELIIIDFFSLQTTITLRLCGPLFTLLIVQSKGWPFLLSAWSIFDFALLVGSHPFSNHWLYWQGFIDLFNRQNPGGDVTENIWFYRVLIIALVVGIVVSIKRLAVGLYLGRKTFSNYSKQLAKVMNKMLLISEVSAAAKEMEKKSWQMERKQMNNTQTDRAVKQPPAPSARISNENLQQLTVSADDDDDGDTVTNGYQTVKSQASSLGALERIIDTNTGNLSSSQRARITQLLGSWEEPARGYHQRSDVPISAVLQFRRALAHMDTDFPFSPAFGLADTRESCVASAQEVYLRLLTKTPESEGTVPFETIATVALQRNGELDLDKVKDLIRVFRPDRDGSLALIDFVRSVDNVYKELRLLRATVVASSKIDEALENIMNIIFYGVMITVILSQLGFDPLALFLSLSSVIVAFAFMISSASAKYFEGVLFILVQRPYGIGDRINVSNPESEASNGGAQGWIVEDVTLFTTSVVLAATNERATISNGSLAKSRIINGARSPKGVLFFTLKFGLEVPYEKIEIFKSAVEKFVKARPREWLSLLGFRANRVEADLGFIEYIVVLQHRDKWQNIVAFLDSKATLQSFCLELQKKMDMRYHSPPLPVDLKMIGNPPLSDLLNGAGSSLASASQQRRGTSDEIDPTSTAYASMMEEELGAVAAMFDGR